MWLILKYIKENPEALIESQKKRGEDTNLVLKGVELDKRWRELLKKVQEMRRERNTLARKIKEDKSLIEKAKELGEKLKVLEEELKIVEKERKETLLKIPNVLHPDVPVGKDDSENVPINYYGIPKVFKDHVEQFLKDNPGLKEYQISEKEFLSHYDLVKNYTDFDKAGKIAGSRFYYMFQDLVFLKFALEQFAIDELTKKGYKLVYPPYLMNREAYNGVVSLEAFEEDLYKIENEDLFLIATSEHPMAALYTNETIPERDLPIKLVGFSTCFRKEAGSHGKDTKGLFRLHQFEKIEQFIFCHPDDSWNYHLELLKNTENLFQKLGLPYRVVDICTGDLGKVASRKYDIEGWFPAQGKYRELASCSNCLDYQSYRLNIRFAEEKGMPAKGHVHTLNNTGCAIQRTLCCILENYQGYDGTIDIPQILKKYMVWEKKPEKLFYK